MPGCLLSRVQSLSFVKLLLYNRKLKQLTIIRLDYYIFFVTEMIP